MEYINLTFSELGVSAGISVFIPDTGIRECNLILRCDCHKEKFGQYISALHKALDKVLPTLPGDMRPVFARYFLSDATNQGCLIDSPLRCAVSVVGQPPLDGSKCALWVYLQEDVEVSATASGYHTVRHGCYTHLWRGSATAKGTSSYIATIGMLADYSDFLSQRGSSVADNCMRTWFFVRDVDVNYKGMVNARNESFAALGLTPDTHFIASTGICGSSPDPEVTVQLDTYAAEGLLPQQITYISAPTHLNNTSEYGVAFERATAIDYGDRRHLLVSGTASIDNQGNVVCTGDIHGQTYRMLENFGARLSSAQCVWHNVTHGIVYLRDMADYTTVRDIIAETCPTLPVVIVLAPVCRSGWLVEMECMAIRPSTDHRFAPL